MKVYEGGGGMRMAATQVVATQVVATQVVA
jgi:hypothetical protein